MSRGHSGSGVREAAAWYGPGPGGGRSHVLDASALLALLHREPGAERVAPLLAGSVVSAVNWSEVVQKAAARGIDGAVVKSGLTALGVEIRPFGADEAERAAALWPATRSRGLSLGDRACLALGLGAGLPVVTADRGWEGLAVGVEVVVVR